MKRRLVLTFLAAVTAVSMIGFAAEANAAFLNSYRLVVPAATTPDDLHLTFTGTGGTIANVTVTPAPATVGVSGGGNTIDITWTSKLAPGAVVVVNFTTNFAPIAFNVGNWTNNSVNLGAATATPLPGASPLVMLLIAMAVGATGIFVLRRRVEA